MEELDRINIQTTSSEGQSVQTVVNNGPINLTTQVSDVPQIQTVIQDNISPISSVINNPFVEVTSVNGMTGDVITEAEILSFVPHKFYKQNTLISYDGNLYWAKDDFTAGASFVRSDWNLIEATGVSDWDDIENKPNFATVATSGSYNDLLNQPSINDATLTIQKNATTIDSFTANSATNKTVNIIVPTDTGDLTNNAGYLKATDIYPVGSVRIFADNLDHSADYGMTWVRYAQGRTLVGVNSEDTDFDNVGDTGGEKKHTLTVAEMPKHKHTLLCGYGEGSAGRDAFRYQYWASGDQGYQDWLVGESGSNTAHNNLQPYIVVSFWRRTA